MVMMVNANIRVGRIVYIKSDTEMEIYHGNGEWRTEDSG